MWGPPVIRWFINPMNTIVIGTINHSYWSYLHQLSYRLGAPQLGRFTIAARSFEMANSTDRHQELLAMIRRGASEGSARWGRAQKPKQNLGPNEGCSPDFCRLYLGNILLKQCHVYHIYIYINHSQSWVVYDIVLPTLFNISDNY